MNIKQVKMQTISRLRQVCNRYNLKAMDLD